MSERWKTPKRDQVLASSHKKKEPLLECIIGEATLLLLFLVYLILYLPVAFNSSKGE